MFFARGLERLHNDERVRRTDLGKWLAKYMATSNKGRALLLVGDAREKISRAWSVWTHVEETIKDPSTGKEAKISKSYRPICSIVVVFLDKATVRLP